MYTTSSMVFRTAAAASVIINRQIRRGPHPNSIFFHLIYHVLVFFSEWSFRKFGYGVYQHSYTSVSPMTRDSIKPIFFNNNNNYIIIYIKLLFYCDALVSIDWYVHHFTHNLFYYILILKYFHISVIVSHMKLERWESITSEIN